MGNFILFRINSYLNPINLGLSYIHLRQIKNPVNLVTYGKNTAGSNQCYGYYNSTSKIGYGPGFQNSCIHSGTIVVSGDLPTTWYNYALASAGTIIDENSTSSNPATNTNTATESICPKGWTLPDNAQILTIGPSGGSSIYVPAFTPVLGGDYNIGAIANESSGHWWGSEAYTIPTSRRRLRYNVDGNYLVMQSTNRQNGLYVRCIQAS